MRTLALAPLALLACTRGPDLPDPIPLGDWSYAIDHLDWRLTELVEEEQIPGLAIALVSDEELVWSQTWGVVSLEDPEPVTEGDSEDKRWSEQLKAEAFMKQTERYHQRLRAESFDD